MCVDDIEEVQNDDFSEQDDYQQQYFNQDWLSDQPILAGLGCFDDTKTVIPQPSQILTVFKKDKSPIHIVLDGGATASLLDWIVL